jgi:RNA-directed DNA polymerase
MHGHGKSDSPIGSGKPPNTAGEPAAEAGERRGRAEGNAVGGTTLRTQRRGGVSHALDRVRQAARRDRQPRVPALLHHGSASERWRAAYAALNPRAAAGRDGETWTHDGQHREAHLQDLAGRLQRGAYRAQPVRRADSPKTDGRPRPLGVPAREDKLVQRAVVEVLDAIADTDFLGFSSGFRPGRSPPDALDALSTGLLTQQGNGVLDADIRSFCDTLQQGGLGQCLEPRVADRRVGRCIPKGRTAGVLAEGERTWSEVGTVQGGSVSPLLANLYLHSGFDLWVQRWRQTQATGDVVVVRFADDFVVGFQDRPEAERCLAELRARFAKFGLALHPDKTRLLEVGPFADRNRRGRGQGKPETFTVLGFTHICGRKRSGRFTVLRQTVRQRVQAKRLLPITAKRRILIEQPGRS